MVVLPIGSKVTIAQGNSLLLQCPVHMYGKLDVKWTKDGVAYDENKDGYIHYGEFYRNHKKMLDAGNV